MCSISPSKFLNTELSISLSVFKTPKQIKHTSLSRFQSLKLFSNKYKVNECRLNFRVTRHIFKSFMISFNYLNFERIGLKPTKRTAEPRETKKCVFISWVDTSKSIYYCKKYSIIEVFILRFVRTYDNRLKRSKSGGVCQWNNLNLDRRWL